MPQDHQAAGAWAEEVALQTLQQQGLRLIARNWRCKLGEIDLIMQERTVRAVVEVRLRRPTQFGAGADTVAWQKQQKLLRTAMLYQQQESYWGDIRFDVVTVEALPGSTSPSVVHIPHAFEQ